MTALVHAGQVLGRVSAVSPERLTDPELGV